MSDQELNVIVRMVNQSILARTDIVADVLTICAATLANFMLNAVLHNRIVEKELKKELDPKLNDFMG